MWRTLRFIFRHRFHSLELKRKQFILKKVAVFVVNDIIMPDWAAMTSRYAKLTVMFLLGLILASSGVLTGSSLPAGTAKRSCCRNGCDASACPPACCARPADNPAPANPASIPSNSLNEWQALAPSFLSLLSSSSTALDELPSPPASDLQAASVPLFQRNCSYLI